MSGWGNIVFKYHIKDVTEKGEIYHKGVVAKSYKGEYPAKLLAKAIDADACLLNIVLDRFDRNIISIHKRISTIMDVDCNSRIVDYGYDDSSYQAQKFLNKETDEDSLNYDIFWSDEQHGLLLIEVAYQADFVNFKPQIGVKSLLRFGCVNRINDVVDFPEGKCVYTSGYTPQDAKTIAGMGIQNYGDGYLELLEKEGIFEKYDKDYKPMTEEDFAEFINTPLTEFLPLSREILSEEDDESEETEIEYDEDGYIKYIADLRLSVRTYNCLRRAGYELVKDVRNLSKEERSKVRNMGSKHWEEFDKRVEETRINV